MAGVAPLCAWGRSVERRTNDSLGRRYPVRVGLVPLYGVSPYHGKIFPPARVALARSRKFTPFPVRMFFRGVSRQLAANRGELPQLAATRGLNPIQYNTAHQLHQNSTIFFPCACVAPRWIILQSIAGAEKRTPLLSSERAQERFYCVVVFSFVLYLCACAAC